MGKPAVVDINPSPPSLVPHGLAAEGARLLSIRSVSWRKLLLKRPDEATAPATRTSATPLVALRFQPMICKTAILAGNGSTRRRPSFAVSRLERSGRGKKAPRRASRKGATGQRSARSLTQ